MTAEVRSQISTGLCSTHPACGRICSCSSWCFPTSLPEWSKIMNRVLVVPWSIAPTNSAISFSAREWVLFRGVPADRGARGLGDRQAAGDAVLEQRRVDEPVDVRTDDRYPAAEVAVLAHQAPLGGVPAPAAGERNLGTTEAEVNAHCSTLS